MTTVPGGLAPLLLALLVWPLATPAQTVPNSGQILQHVEKQRPMQPAHAPKVRVHSPATEPGDDTTLFQVRRIRVQGNSAFPAGTLHALVASGEGRRMTLAQLQALVQRITDYYHAHGYPLARAVVPAQTLRNGIVQVRVIEARYDTVGLVNHSRVGNGLLRATLSPMQPGRIVTQASLDRALLLLGDLPGVKPHATLRPGAHTGTTRVDVTADAGALVDGELFLDNAGNRYTGRVRAGAELDINSPLHHGDRLSVSALSSGKHLANGRIAYQFTLNGAGTRLGAAWSALRYDLGGAASALQAHGTAHVASAWLAQPLVRSRRTSLDARVQFNRKRLHDDLGATGLRNRRHNDNWVLGLYGQRRDVWLGGGLSRASLAVTHGRLGFADANARAVDAATAAVQGDYTHWNAQLSRVQQTAPRTQLLVAINGQWSRGNLDSSEQFLLGGPDSVRGYAVGTAAGANGWLATLALRHDLDWGCGGTCRGRIFLDSGGLRINAQPWTRGNNHVRLSDVGLGFDWIGAHQWLARVELATPISARPSDRRDGARFWIQMSKGF